LVGYDVVKRWVNEAQEAVNSDAVMVQYHALGLLYHIRKTDRLAVTKLVSKLTRYYLLAILVLLFFVIFFLDLDNCKLILNLQVINEIAVCSMSAYKDSC